MLALQIPGAKPRELPVQRRRHPVQRVGAPLARAVRTLPGVAREDLLEVVVELPQRTLSGIPFPAATLGTPARTVNDNTPSAVLNAAVGCGTGRMSSTGIGRLRSGLNTRKSRLRPRLGTAGGGGLGEF